MKLSRLLLLLSALLLSSCFIPEKFTATLNVAKDYSYTFEYDGIITFGPALGEIAKNGALPQKAEDDMRQGTAKTFKKEDGFDRASYEGKGRWSVHCKKTGTLAATTKLFGDGLPIVTIRRAPNGNVSIEGITVDAKIAQQLKAVNCVIDGKLEITTDMPVMRHNATETPKMFGLFGSYGWNISSEKLTSPIMMLGSAAPPAASVPPPPPAQPQPFVRPGTAELAEVDRADAEINDIYKRVMSKLTPDSQKRLRDAQRAWIKARDAEVISIVGPPTGGSGYRVDHATALAKLIRERTEVLRGYLNDPTTIP